MIEKSLAAGKMVVTEKPVTMTKEEFSLLLSKYEGKPVYPVMQNRIEMIRDDSVFNGEHYRKAAEDICATADAKHLPCVQTHINSVDFRFALQQ